MFLVVCIFFILLHWGKEPFSCHFHYLPQSLAWYRYSAHISLFELNWVEMHLNTLSLKSMNIIPINISGEKPLTEEFFDIHSTILFCSWCFYSPLFCLLFPIQIFLHSSISHYHSWLWLFSQIEWGLARVVTHSNTITIIFQDFHKSSWKGTEMVLLCLHRD